jgi:hypothetical protein
MDRRTFNKAAAGLLASLALPFKTVNQGLVLYDIQQLSY